MPVPLLIQICHGVSLYSCNVLSELYLLEARCFFPKALGVWYFYDLFGLLILIKCICSWLIDTDKDEEGMKVIADLHGGDPDNIEALEEFREIKDRVMAEVNFSIIDCRISS